MKFLLTLTISCFALASASVHAQSLADVLSSIQERARAVQQAEQVRHHLANYPSPPSWIPEQELIEWRLPSGPLGFDFPTDENLAAHGIDARLALINQAVSEFRHLQRKFYNIRAEDLSAGAKLGDLRYYLLEDFPDPGRVDAANYHAVLGALARDVRRLRVMPWPMDGQIKTFETLTTQTPGTELTTPGPAATEVQVDWQISENGGLHEYSEFAAELHSSGATSVLYAGKRDVLLHQVALFASLPNRTDQLAGNVSVVARVAWTSLPASSLAVEAPSSWNHSDCAFHVIHSQENPSGGSSLGLLPAITANLTWSTGANISRAYPTGASVDTATGFYPAGSWQSVLLSSDDAMPVFSNEDFNLIYSHYLAGRRIEAVFVPNFALGLDAPGKAVWLDKAELGAAGMAGDASPTLHPAKGVLAAIPLGVGLHGTAMGYLGITPGDDHSYYNDEASLTSRATELAGGTGAASGLWEHNTQPEIWELSSRFDTASSLRFIGPTQDFHVVYETGRGEERGAALPSLIHTTQQEEDMGCWFFFRSWDLPRLRQVVSRDFIVDITPLGHYKNEVKIYRRSAAADTAGLTPGQLIAIDSSAILLRTLTIENPQAAGIPDPHTPEKIHITDGGTIYKVWRDGYPTQGIRSDDSDGVIPPDLNFEIMEGSVTRYSKFMDFNGIGKVTITTSVDGEVLSEESIDDEDWYWFLGKQPKQRVMVRGNQTTEIVNVFDAELPQGSQYGWFPEKTTITPSNQPTLHLKWNESGRLSKAIREPWCIEIEPDGNALRSRSIFGISNVDNTGLTYSGGAACATTWTEWLGNDTTIKTYSAPDGDITEKTHPANTITELTLGKTSGTGLPGLPHKLTHRDGTETRWTWNVANDHSGTLIIESGVFSSNTLANGQRQTSSWNKRGYPTSTQSQLVAGGTVQTASTTAGNFTEWGAPQQFTDTFTGLTTTLTFDGTLNRLTSIQNALGLTTTLSNYDVFNRPRQVTSNGITASHTYSGLGLTTSYSDGGITPDSQSSFSTNAEGTEIFNSRTWGGVTQTRNLVRGEINTTLTGTHSLLGATTATFKNTDGSLHEADGPSMPFGGSTGQPLSVNGAGLLVTKSAVAEQPGTFSETHSDSWGRPHIIITPSKSGSGSTQTLYSYSNPAAAIQRIITTEPNGRILITESEANGTITRAGIDVNGNGSLGASDRYTESISTAASGKITTILKVTEDDGLREIIRTEWTPASGVTVTKINGNEETLTSTSDYTAKTVKVESSKGWETTTAINPLGLPNGNLLNGTGIPTTNLTPVWRADGSLEKITLNIGGENHEAQFNPNGTLASLTLPGQGNILGGHHIDEDGEKITILGTTYHRSHDGTLREIITDRDSDDEALAGHKSTYSPDNNGGYKNLIEPVGAADTTVHFNAALAPTGKTYADNSGTAITYTGELPTSILTPRGHAIGLVYSNDGAKDLVETAFPALSSGPFPIPGHSEAYGYDRAGRINFLGDNSGGRTLVYQNGRHAKTHYTTGLLKGYEIIPGRHTAGRHTGTLIKRDNATIHTTAQLSNGASDQILELTSHGITATPQRDLAGNITGYQWSDGTHTVIQHWTRGPGGRIEAASNNVPNAPSFDYLIDPQNPAESFDPKGRRLKCVTSSGTWTYTYGLGGQLAKAEHPTLGTFHYHFDPIGRRTVEANPSSTHPNLTDLLNRTTAWKHSGPKSLTLKAHPDARVWFNGVEIQNFDGEHPVELGTPGEAGQWVPWQTLAILEGAGEGAGNPPQNPNASPDAKAAQSGAAWIPPANEIIHYDDSGNRLDNAQWDYGWDAKNQLTRARTKNHTTAPQAFDLTFTYDSEGRRVKKHVIELANGVIKSEKIITYLWDGWDLLYERHQLPSGLTTLERKYLWGPDLADGAAGGAGGLLLISETRGSQTQHLIPLYDGTGHVIALTNLNKDLLAQYTYGPFGEKIHATGPLAQTNPWRYATKYLDEETGLYYFGHRYFDPVTGQWLSREPLGESESINLYAYCHNDPVNHVDVLGLYLTKISVERIRLDMLLFQLMKNPTVLPREPSQEFKELAILKHAPNAEELGLFKPFSHAEFERAFLTIRNSGSPELHRITWEDSEANRKNARFEQPEWNPSQTRALNLGAANTPLNASINQDWLLPSGAGTMGASFALRNLRPILPMLRSGAKTELYVLSTEVRVLNSPVMTAHERRAMTQTMDSGSAMIFSYANHHAIGTPAITLRQRGLHHQGVVDDIASQLFNQGYLVKGNGGRFYDSTGKVYSQADLVALRSDGTPVIFEVKTGGAITSGR